MRISNTCKCQWKDAIELYDDLEWNNWTLTDVMVQYEFLTESLWSSISRFVFSSPFSVDFVNHSTLRVNWGLCNRVSINNIVLLFLFCRSCSFSSSFRSSRFDKFQDMMSFWSNLTNCSTVNRLTIGQLTQGHVSFYFIRRTRNILSSFSDSLINDRYDYFILPTATWKRNIQTQTKMKPFVRID